MEIIDNIKELYLYEQNLLKSCTSKLLESSNDSVHDNILNVFDNIDEINRKLNKFLKEQEIIYIEKTTRKKKEELFEELDAMLLRINE